MQESINLRGIWFLPNDVVSGISGFLQFTPGKGVHLQLMGVFDGAREELHDPELINGISEDGKKITLYKCTRILYGFSSNSYEISSYDAVFMFVGDHFSSENDLIFQNINFTFADLDIWIGIFGFKKVQSNENTKEINIEYKRPDDILFEIAESIMGAIRFNATYPIGNRRSTAAVTQTIGVDIWKKSNTATLTEMIDWFESFQRFMTLVYFKRPLLNRLSLEKTKSFAKEEDDNISIVDLYFQTKTTSDNYKNATSSSYFLFTYNQVKEKFGQIVKKWFELEYLLQPTVAGLTEAFIHRDHPIEYKFLGLAQAIETFHRRTYNRTGDGIEQHKEKIRSILDSVEARFKDWLNEKLQYSHEPTLKVRLSDLASRIPEPVKKVLFTPTVSQFLNQIRDSRNYYTHYSDEIKSRALVGAKLFTLSERMKIFLVCLVLGEMGFSRNEIVHIILGKGVFLFNHIMNYEDVRSVYQDWVKSTENKTPQ